MSTADQPITLPGNPFWNVFRRFGADELMAMAVNVVATAIFALFFQNPVLLSIAGPIVEKLGFFPLHLKGAWNVYRTTPKKDRHHFSYYVKHAVKTGSKSLLEDLIVHDPIYILLMFSALLIYPAAPVWMLATISFIISVFVVSGLEVAVTELFFRQHKRMLHRYGFTGETYYESRFLLPADTDTNATLQKIAREFKLDVSKKLKYHDTYYQNTFPEFCGRRPLVRVRMRDSPTGEDWNPTVQITYTRPLEISSQKLEQYRYFPIIKEKLYITIDQDKPECMDELKEKKLRKLMMKKTQGRTKELTFHRTYAHDDDLYVSVDEWDGQFLLEIKVRKDKLIMIQAMRYCMRHFPLIQTTSPKCEILLDGA